MDVASRWSLFGTDRGAALFVALGAVVAGLFVLEALSTVHPEPPWILPTNGAGWFVFFVAVTAVAVGLDRTRGLVPSYLLALGPVTAAGYYRYHVYRGGWIDFSLYVHFDEVLLSAAVHWTIGVACVLVLRWIWTRSFGSSTSTV